MGDILIIGAGFAGLEAARFFARNRLKIGSRQVILVDAKPSFDFLPVLPDVAGGRIDAKNAVIDLSSYLRRLKINFQQDEVVRVDIQEKEVFLKSGRSLSYEFLLLTPGSVTNYYGFKELEGKAFELKTVNDALRLKKALEDDRAKSVLVAGGGYTGVEIAANLAFLLRRRGVKRPDIHIVEKGEDIVSSLPLWIQDYCRISLCAYRVSMHCSSFIKEVTSEHVKLSNGVEFKNYLLVWTAGVASPAFTGSIDVKKDTQGRFIVDEYMGIDRSGNRGCYAAGDLANFKYKGRPLRMAVQFSIAQGRLAAKNITRSIAGKKLLCYRPRDLGFLVPLSNGKACGKVLFFRMFGFLGWVLHYGMCIWRSLSFKNRFGLFCNVFLRWRR